MEGTTMKTQKQFIKCDMCGELFTPLRSTQHYCRKRIVRNCLICGDEFETNCSPDGVWTCAKPECKKQSKQVRPPQEKTCKRCGNKFTTIYYKQSYCNEVKEKECPICGNTFKYTCGIDVNATCSSKCQATLIKEQRRKNIAKETRVCKWCGKEFHPKEVRDVYCYNTHYNTCAVCGKQFVFDPRKHRAEESRTCSKECMGKLMSMNQLNFSQVGAAIFSSTPPTPLLFIPTPTIRLPKFLFKPKLPTLTETSFAPIRSL